MGRKRKTSMGKQKIEIKKIEAKEARRVCFSKRKSGLFNKANELATLCGAKVAILIESPAGRPFAFGCPSVGHVTDLFLCGGNGSTETDAYEPQQLSKIQQLNDNLMEVGSKIQENEKKKAMLVSKIAQLSEKNESVRRIESGEDLNLAELKKLKELLERFKDSIDTKILKGMASNSGIPCSTAQNLYGNGIGQASSSANPFITKLKTKGEGPSDFKVFSRRMTFAELGLKVDITGLNHGKGAEKHGTGYEVLTETHSDSAFGREDGAEGPSEPRRAPDDDKVPYVTVVELDLLGGRGLDMNLDSFEDKSYNHAKQMNPFIPTNANDAASFELRRAPNDDKVPYRTLVELNLLGGRGITAVENEPKIESK